MQEQDIMLDHSSSARTQGKFQLHIDFNMTCSNNDSSVDIDSAIPSSSTLLHHHLPRINTQESTNYFYEDSEMHGNNGDATSTNVDDDESQQQQLNALTQAMNLLTIIVASTEEDVALQADMDIDHINQSWKLEQTGFPRLYNACKQMKEHLRLSSMETDQSILSIHEAYQKTISEQKKNDKLKRVIYKLVRENKDLQIENRRLQSDLDYCRREKKILKHSIRDHLKAYQYSHSDGNIRYQEDETKSSCDPKEGSSCHDASTSQFGTSPFSTFVTKGCATLRLEKREKPKRSISRSVMNYVKSFKSEKERGEEQVEDNVPTTPKKNEEKNYDVSTDGESHHDDDCNEYHIVTPTMTGVVNSTSTDSIQDCITISPSVPCMNNSLSSTTISTLSPVPLLNDDASPIEPHNEYSDDENSSSENLIPPSTRTPSSEEGNDENRSEMGQVKKERDIKEKNCVSDDTDSTPEIPVNSSDDEDGDTLGDAQKTKNGKNDEQDERFHNASSPTIDMKGEKEEKEKNETSQKPIPSPQPKTFEIKFENNDIGLQLLPIRDPKAKRTLFLVCGFQGFDKDIETKPPLGARLIKVGANDLEKESWIMLNLIAFLKKNDTAPFTMCFRDDPVSPDHWEKVRARYRRNAGS